MLKSISTAQVQWSLICYCLRNKVNHLFRTIPPRLTEQFHIKFDKLLKSFIESHLRTILTEVSWIQFKLSFHDGGSGLADSE